MNNDDNSMDIYGGEEVKLSSQSPYEAPKFNEVRNKEWIPYIDNDKKTQYPDKLTYYKNNSSLHGAILRNMSDQVAGNGVLVEETDPLYDKTMEWLKNISTEGYDVVELINRMADDRCDFKGFALKITWSSDGGSILNVDHLDFSKVRAHKVDENGFIPGYFYSYNWDTQRPKTVFVEAFNPNKMKDLKKSYDKAVEEATKNGIIDEELTKMVNSNNEQILYFHPYASNEFYYPLPEYCGAINSIISDISADQYAVGAMRNGLTANHIITVTGNYSDKQQRLIAKKLDRAHIRSKEAGLPMITFKKSEEEGISVEAIAVNGKDGRYTSINENNLQKILSGHGVTSPMLVGIKTEGSLGGAQEMQDAAALFYRNTIRPKQNDITKILNNILSINGLSEIKIEKLNIFSDNNELEDSETTENKE